MKRICMIAHRGYSSRYLMNTEQAFIEAARHGSGGAETDVRRTKDGVYVLSHDAEARFADGTELLVAESTFAELTAKPLKNDKTENDVYLCTFRRYLEVMRDNDMVCFVELKGPFTDAQVGEVFSMVAEVYDLKKCILQSFDFDNLLRARAQFPDLPLMLTYGCNESHYERCFDYGFSLDIDYSVVTEEIIRQFHDRGLEVAVWTVNTPEAFERFKHMDVDYIESDVYGGYDL